MNWGKGIILSFVLFIAVIFTMVYISVNTEFSLVADNYYEQEINYDDQLERIRNFNALVEKPNFDFDRNKGLISLSFAPDLAQAVKDGSVVFFRASGAKHDKELPLLLNDVHQFAVSSNTLLKGAWTLQLSWTDGLKEYYHEIKFVI